MQSGGLNEKKKIQARSKLKSLHLDKTQQNKLFFLSGLPLINQIILLRQTLMACIPPGARLCLQFLLCSSISYLNK